jgi:hypothetical protein
MMHHFTAYKQCIRSHESLARDCAAKFLDAPCKKASIRVIKTVRATMDLPMLFLDRYDNFRLIHLFRDPRGTAKSRLDSSWSLGKYDRKNLTRAAQVYCQNVVSDIQLSQLLEQAYPGKMMTMLSDDFVEDPLPVLNEIGSLIGKNSSEMSTLLVEKFKSQGIEQKAEHQANKDVSGVQGSEEPPGGVHSRKLLSVEPKKKVIKKKRKGKNTLKGEKRLQRWQSALTWAEVKAIERECAEFYSLVKYDW